MAQQAASKRGSNHWLWLLLIPCIAVIWVPFYGGMDPQLWGFPFFYWYQLAWVLGSALTTGLVYVMTKNNNVAKDPKEGT
jgi:hypothetical protein